MASLRNRERLSLGLASGTIIVMPLLLGGVPRWALAILLGLTLAAAMPFVRSRRDMPLAPALSATPLLVLLMIALGVTCLQAIPLPIDLIDALSPARASLARDNAAALGDGLPGWVPLSHDVPATLLEIAKLCSYVVFAYVCLRIVATSLQAGYRLVSAIVIAGCVLSVVAVAHYATGSSAVYGIFETSVDARSPPPFLAPLVSPNHLAAYLAITVPLALGRAASCRGNTRTLFVGAAILCAALLVLSGSRGGLLSCGVGVTLFVTLAVHARRSQSKRRSRRNALSLATISACALLLLGVVILSGGFSELGAISEDLQRNDTRWSVWSSSTPLVSDYWLAGAGRGAFETVFTRHSPVAQLTYSHAENEYLQLAIEWGLIAAGALLVFALAIALRIYRASRGGALNPTLAACIGALVGVLLHNLVDFNFELPGVAVAAIAIVSVLSAPRLSTLSSRAHKRLVIGRIAGCVAIALVGVLVCTPWSANARADSQRIVDLRRDAEVSPEALVAQSADAFRRHPTDYKLAFLVADAHRRLGGPGFSPFDCAPQSRIIACRATPLLNRALYLHPTHPDLHFQAAKWLSQSERPTQAFVEYALALGESLHPAKIVPDLLRRFPRHDVQSALPVHLVRGPPIAYELMRAKRYVLATDYLERLVAIAPDDTKLLKMAVQFALRAEKLDRAVTRAEALYALRKDIATGTLLGQCLVRAKRLAGARDVISETLARARAGGTVGELFILENLMGAAELASGRLELAKQAFERALGYARQDEKRRAVSHRRLADIEARLGNEQAAAWHRKQVGAGSDED